VSEFIPKRDAPPLRACGGVPAGYLPHFYWWPQADSNRRPGLERAVPHQHIQRVRRRRCASAVQAIELYEGARFGGLRKAALSEGGAPYLHPGSASCAPERVGRRFDEGQVRDVAEGPLTPAAGLSDDVLAGVRFVNAPATLRELIAPRWCVQRHVPRQETEGPRGRPCRDARQSVLCARDEWRC